MIKKRIKVAITTYGVRRVPMKVAVSTDGNLVSAHFGRCPSFTIAEIDDGKVTSKEVIDNPGHHPGFLPEFLHGKGVDYIIAGGMGMRAQQLFSQNNIEAVLGVQGNVDEVLELLASEKLAGGDSLCKPGAGKGYGVDKSVCDHSDADKQDHCR